jgi:hypothetical protein
MATTDEARAELQLRYDGCFNREARTDARRRADAAQEWEHLRRKHLPLTLELMCSAGDTPRYTAPGERGEGEDRALLLMAGYSEEQLALVIAAHARHDCRRVVPFTEERVWSVVESRVRECLLALDLRVGTDVVFDPLVPVEPGKPAHVFQQIVWWIRQNIGMAVAIDCTGGQKPMDAGAAHAASFYGLTAYYLDFREYDEDFRRPYPWTCLYRKLDLPEAAFSLHRRGRVFNAWQHRHFADAMVAMNELMEDVEQSEFFDAEDRADLGRAADAVRRSNAWFQVAYHDPLLSDQLLHAHFRGASDPRALMETLREPASFDLLFEYVVDEYWRLALQHERGNYREALVGAVGLTELVVDALFFHPWFGKTTIARIPWAEWTDRETPDPPPALAEWVGRPLPVECLPSGALGPKGKLLRKGRTTITVRARAAPDGRSELIPFGETEGKRLDVQVDLSGAPLIAISNSVWERVWGNPPEGRWVKTRNALVHVRAPLLAREDAGCALGHYLPRFIELLRRVGTAQPVDPSAAGDDDWVRWRVMSQYGQQARVPWQQSDDTMRRWLRLAF